MPARASPTGITQKRRVLGASLHLTRARRRPVVQKPRVADPPTRDLLALGRGLPHDALLPFFAAATRTCRARRRSGPSRSGLPETRIIRNGNLLDTLELGHRAASGHRAGADEAHAFTACWLRPDRPHATSRNHPGPRPHDVGTLGSLIAAALAAPSAIAVRAQKV
jgi:hypothetical protein